MIMNMTKVVTIIELEITIQCIIDALGIFCVNQTRIQTAFMTHQTHTQIFLIVIFLQMIIFFKGIFDR